MHLGLQVLLIALAGAVIDMRNRIGAALGSERRHWRDQHTGCQQCQGEML